jgi:Domain of unknown function (DUF4359)
MELIAPGQWPKTLASTTGAVLLLGAGLVATNPTQPTYENYLVSQIESRLQQECSKAGMNLLGNVANTACLGISAVSSPYLKQSIQPVLSNTTTRQNLVIASIYQTELEVPELKFSGKVSAIGAFNTFLVYQMP